MQEYNLSEKILDKIKEKKIQPTAKWFFWLKDSVVWFLVIISLIIGGLATSVILFLFEYNEWDLYDKIAPNIWAFILLSLPYFWLVILLIFVIFILYNFKHTKGGYKYRSLYVIISSVLISIILGFIFYNLGLGNAIDNVLEDNAPLYGQIINRKQTVLHHPEKGILPGQIIKIINPRELLILDISNQQWQILISDSVQECPCQLGRKIIAIGQPLKNNIFLANFIRELRPAFEPPVSRQPSFRIWLRL
jgi:hypothetical protein